MSLFNGVPQYNGVNLSEWITRATLTMNGNLNGKTNNTGIFTLAANTVSSTIVLAKGRLGPDTIVNYFPKTVNAATEFGAGKIFVSTVDVANNKFVVTHTNTADTDKIFAFSLVG